MKGIGYYKIGFIYILEPGWYGLPYFIIICLMDMMYREGTFITDITTNLSLIIIHIQNVRCDVRLFIFSFTN